MPPAISVISVILTVVLLAFALYLLALFVCLIAAIICRANQPRSDSPNLLKLAHQIMGRFLAKYWPTILVSEVATILMRLLLGW